MNRLADRIRLELIEIEMILRRAEEGWQCAVISKDDIYIDSVALNLHGFYTELERIFELVAATMDGNKLVGENWHQQLLQQMADEYPRLRPAVISEESSRRLIEFLNFRQIVRRGNTIELDPANIQKLITDAPDLFDQVKAELLAFADFLYTVDQ